MARFFRGAADRRRRGRLCGRPAFPMKPRTMTINKVCGSGLKAIMLGADAIRLDNSRVVIAGGMESMSAAPYFLKKARSGYRLGHGEIFDLMVYDGLQDPYSGRVMGEIGETGAERHGFTRAEQDAYALRSYRLAQTAVREGIFREEIVPVLAAVKKGEVTVETDEEPFKVEIDRLPQLKPVFRPAGTITAGNASTISDGAALALLTDEAGLKQFNLRPRARIAASASESRQIRTISPKHRKGRYERCAQRRG